MTEEQCCCEDKTACGKDSCPRHRFLTIEFPDGSRFRKLDTRRIMRGDELGEDPALANRFEHHGFAVYEGRKLKQGQDGRGSSQPRGANEDLASQNNPYDHQLALKGQNDNNMLDTPQVYHAHYCGHLDPRGRNFDEFLNPGKHLCLRRGKRCEEQKRNTFQSDSVRPSKNEHCKCHIRTENEAENKFVGVNKGALRNTHQDEMGCENLSANEYPIGGGCPFKNEAIHKNDCPHFYECLAENKRAKRVSHAVDHEYYAEKVCDEDDSRENECNNNTCPNQYRFDEDYYDSGVCPNEDPCSKIADRCNYPFSNVRPIRKDCPLENQHGTRDGDSLGSQSLCEEKYAIKNKGYVIDEVGGKHGLHGVKLRERPVQDGGESQVVEDVEQESSLSNIIKESVENEVERTKHILSRVRTPEEIEKISQALTAAPAWSGRKARTLPAQNLSRKSQKEYDSKLRNQPCPSKNYLNNVVHVTVDSLEKVVKALKKSYKSNDDLKLPDDPELSNKILARKLIETQKGVDELKEEMQNLLHSLQDILLKFI